MRKTLLYIIGIAAIALTSCSDDMMEQADFLNGKEKTPLSVSALLDKSSSAMTRAVNKEFEENDELIAYLRHVTWDGSTGARTNVAADHAPQLVTFTKGSTAMAVYNDADITPIGTGVALGLTSSNTQKATDITPDHPLYWDDFSNSVDAAHDLRTSGHYLESYYGYCYNGSPAYGETGSHISTALNEENGTLGWTVATDQSTGFKTSDLLWSYEQTPVAYTHAAGRAGLVLPFTHAMSKVTIEVVCGAGFESDVAKNFGSATVTLDQMNTVTSLTAPTATAAVGTTPADIQMQKGTPAAKQCSFSALIAPTLFKAGKNLATIAGVDGNNYTIPLTDAVLTTATAPAQAWSTQLAAAKVDDVDATTVTSHAASGYTAANGGITKPGVNYLITVTINKQEITVKATIQDWDVVSATGVGVIQFSNDITEKTGAIATELQTNGFDLYKSANTDPAVYGVAATTYTYGGDPAKWSRNREIYWPNGTDRFFFRALSGATADDPATDAVNESLTMANNQDVLWGTTSAHKGPELTEPYSLNYNEGDAIAPRTGDVPLTFYHPMAKITINLEDENKAATVEGWAVDDARYSDYSNPLNPRINLAGAKVQITNTATGGTIDLHTGNITPDAVSEKMLGDGTGYNPYKLNGTDNALTTDWLNGYVVTPQTIADNAMLVITLADGTTYRLQLNECVDNSDAPIGAWVRGKHYAYTITLSKERITFRALIENWDEVEGGGKATLEWD